MCPRYWYDSNKGVLSARVFIAWLEVKARDAETKPVYLVINCYLGMERPDSSDSVKPRRSLLSPTYG